MYPRPTIPVVPVFSLNTFFPIKKKSAFISLIQGNQIRTTSGRMALALALEHAGIGRDDKVLVPFYHCTSMVDPVTHFKASSEFYRVEDDLTINIAELEAHINNKIRALIVVHYFGFPQKNIKEIRALCDLKNIILIEDCAHLLFLNEGSEVGKYGDYTIVSVMKFLPIYDGGLLFSNKHDLSNIAQIHGRLPFQLKAVFDTIEKSIEYQRISPIFVMIIKSIIAFVKRTKKLLYKTSRIGPSAADGGFDFDEKWIHIKMSIFSQLLMTLISSARVVKNRRLNYLRYLDVSLKLKNAHPLFPTLPPCVVPYIFPLVILGREEMFNELKLAGIPIYRWDFLKGINDHLANEYATCLLQLPCHQELLKAELDWMIDKLQGIVG